MHCIDTIKKLFLVSLLLPLIVSCASDTARYNDFSCDQLLDAANEHLLEASSVITSRTLSGLTFSSPDAQDAFIDSLQSKIDEELDVPLQEAKVIGKVMQRGGCFEEPFVRYEDYQAILQEFEDFDLSDRTGGHLSF